MVWLLTSCCVGIDAATNGVVSVENEAIRVSFDLDKGLYHAEEKSTGTALFRDAVMDTLGKGVIRRSASVTNVTDTLGKGKMLRVVSVNEDYALGLNITLYEGRSAIVLGSSSRGNSRSWRPGLFRGFTPFSKATFFPDDKEIRNPLTLDGNSAYGVNEVLPAGKRTSQNNLLLTYQAGNLRRSVVMGGLTYHEYTKSVSLSRGAGGTFVGSMQASDPVPRMVDAQFDYQIKDLFYVDVRTGDPFTALADYAKAVALAQPAKPNLYNFPTVCSWYVKMTGGQKRRDTVGAVELMDAIKSSGFLKYSTAAVRLVPDTYCFEARETEQGWWDDAHWQKRYYTAPYETSEKYCNAIRERGGLPFTYIQTGMPSDDFAIAHPEWMLFNTSKHVALTHRHHKPYVRMDYTDKGFQEHVRKCWANLGKAGLAGVMFDYPETGWPGEGGTEDPYMTAAATYRKIFELAREGLGPEGHLHERNLGEPSSSTSRPDQYIPWTDMTLGLVDSQRVEGDSTTFSHKQISRCAMRWYKNRLLYVYDIDAKSLLFRTFTSEKFKVADEKTSRQAILTMVYVSVGRLLLADSFKDYSPEIVHEISRIFPMHTERRTARPVDLFLGKGDHCPRVYDYAVTEDWHQVTFFNTNVVDKAKVSAPMSGDLTTQGALGLDSKSEYYVYDFWHDRLVGKIKGADKLEQELDPGEARMMSVRKVADHPQVLSTDRHVMQGYLELSEVKWDAASRKLSGKAELVAGELMRIVLAGNGAQAKDASADGAGAKIEVHAAGNDYSVLTLVRAEKGQASWCVNYK